ncbi:RagB/SusD family nutrient uptake outer membrane protein [Negadavirga shengliensis]|uniref:RagB/SusD family nutrient uptake outer membrane protein n=1 Tax=Negadavirga shengliensis TaxID=1389218 RepID=A0ABV9T0L8_9BACT
MKSLYNKKIKFVGLLFMIYSLHACNFIDIKTPTDRIVTATLFEDDATATAAVLGLYGRLVDTTPPFSNGAVTIFTGLASDELEYTGTSAAQVQFFENNIAVNNSIVYTNFWRNAYEIIYQANACLDGLENSTSITENTKNQLLGEAYFIRAFCYWYLVNLFADVPLISGTDYETNAQLPRTNVALVKENILSDLFLASDLLTPDYPSAGKFRVNYYTVLALLSRYYLYEENWIEAERLTTEILQSPLYQYESDIISIFLTESTESIWQLVTADQSLFNTVEGNRFIPTTSATTRPNYTVSQHLLESFEEGDVRKVNWIETKTVQGVDYYYPFKYKIRLNAIKTETYVIFRLGEIYLNRAESRVHLGDISGALDDLNIIRGRANLPEHTVGNTADILSAIYRERRIELFAEWGNRWFDLKRTSRIGEILTAVKPNWQPTAEWLPIPANEILVNSNLTQNPGYN